MQDISQWKVLVVDDEPDNLGVIQLVLEFQDATVWTASSAIECLDILEREQPTLILVDIQMPDISGLELLRRIRERMHWRDIPVIAVTAYSMQGDRERILSEGFDGYMSKPINAMTLVDELVTLLESGQS
jgi:CheY-like chemotaxis protein